MAFLHLPGTAMHLSIRSVEQVRARSLAPGRCHRKSIPNNKQVIRNPSQYYMLIRMAVEDLVPPSPKRNTFIPSYCKILHGLAVAPTSPPAPSAPLQRHPESPLATFPSPTYRGKDAGLVLECSKRNIIRAMIAGLVINRRCKSVAEFARIGTTPSASAMSEGVWRNQRAMWGEMLLLSR